MDFYQFWTYMICLTATLAVVSDTFLATAYRAPSVTTVPDSCELYLPDPLATTDNASSIQGHISKDCTQPQRRACYTCGSEGYVCLFLPFTGC